MADTWKCGGVSGRRPLREVAPAVRKNLRDRDFVASLLAELHGVDAEDPRIACVLGAVTADPHKPPTANAANAPPPPVGSNGSSSRGGVGGSPGGGGGDAHPASHHGDQLSRAPQPPPAMGSPVVGSALAAARTVGRRPERRTARTSSVA